MGFPSWSSWAPKFPKVLKVLNEIFSRFEKLLKVQISTSEFSRCLVRDLENSQGATAFSGFVRGLQDQRPLLTMDSLRVSRYGSRRCTIGTSTVIIGCMDVHKFD